MATDTSYKRHEYTRPIPAYRARFTRTKKGCLGCRTRRKKCDEHKPICYGCHERDMVCSWPDQPSGKVQANTTRSTRRVDSAEPLPSPSRRPASAEGVLEDYSEMPCASLLLAHFLAKTSQVLVGRDALRNPYLFSVLPVAYSNPLVMHALLAISGVHMLHVQPSVELENAKYSHYGKAVEGLKTKLAAWTGELPRETLNLFYVSTLLCTYEALEGNSQGNLVLHLRACREFAQYVVANDYPDSDHDIIGHSLEIYVYTALLARLQIPEMNEACGETRSSRDLLTLLEHLRLYRTFGNLFGPADHLYELMPAIAQQIWCPGLDSQVCPHHSSMSAYESLKAKVESWSGEDITSESVKSATGSMAEHANGVMIQNTLLMLLHHSRLRSRSRHEQVMDAKIQLLIDDNLLLHDLIADSPMSSVSLWPTVVTGSLMRRNDQRLNLARKMKSHPTQAPVTSRAVQALNWLWNDNESDDLGLQGLFRVANKRGEHIFLS